MKVGKQIVVNLACFVLAVGNRMKETFEVQQRLTFMANKLMHKKREKK
jgi:hypothetical protein